MEEALLFSNSVDVIDWITFQKAGSSNISNKPRIDFSCPPLLEKTGKKSEASLKMKPELKEKNDHVTSPCLTQFLPFEAGKKMGMESLSSTHTHTHTGQGWIMAKDATETYRYLVRRNQLGNLVPRPISFNEISLCEYDVEPG